MLTWIYIIVLDIYGEHNFKHFTTELLTNKGANSYKLTISKIGNSLDDSVVLLKCNQKLPLYVFLYFIGYLTLIADSLSTFERLFYLFNTISVLL